ncbi:RNA recognition domain-containing protein [Colletotrichum higginsianum IMI 349063]|uniref:Nucleolar protein 12 n=2 Tax=Colletotrichum higginsianum TaxID=80884 RepID=A0A1B7XYT9_COLHI|nr:RNA recognition domain-containing protein [Colletotrichum higginsianum IMI 349063]OBR04925.1 RNA recognition domain-containing protein [Colletotrichum higginsianum IMI 349063]TIC93516.1 Nucleolar protein 12 [Colletotrichum higginsianum]
MAKGSTKLAASGKAIDPTLDALFASSAGPVKAPEKTSQPEKSTPKARAEPQSSDFDEELPDADEGDDEELSELGSDEDVDLDDIAEDESDAEDVEEEASEPAPKVKKERKRKRVEDDIEGKYLSKLAEAEVTEKPAGKRSKTDTESKEDGEEATSETSSDAEAPLVHESLAADAKTKVKDSEMEKASRTVFLSNVASDAIDSKSAKRTLEAHLVSVLDKDATPPQKIESIRFRSIAFSGGALPKRAAYITKSLMNETTKSANAYVVFSTPAAARKVCAELNGTIVLDRHLRVDSVAHPAPTDHRRCVFVGNLGFIDDETILTTNEEGETVQKKRTKVPADIEEGLWRTFGKHAGKVENVRVVRDPKTRVGKGFAYVQFYDGNHVEAALLLDGKKYPPMLPRIMRVTRAKAPHKTALAMERTNKARAAQSGGPGAPGNTKYRAKITPEQQSKAGRAARLLGRSGANRERLGERGDRGKPRAPGNGSGAVPKDDMKAPEDFIFEGRRASAKDGRPKDLKFNKRSKPKGGGVKKSKPVGRGAKRAAEWKKKKN